MLAGVSGGCSFECFSGPFDAVACRMVSDEPVLVVMLFARIGPALCFDLCSRFST